MKKIFRLVILIVFFGLSYNIVNAQDCSIPEMSNGGWVYNDSPNTDDPIDGPGATITRQISFSPSSCSNINLDFQYVPDWITITRPTQYTIQIVVAENPTTSSRYSGLIVMSSPDINGGSGTLGVILIDQNGCTNWYPDSDGDGYGDIHGQPVVSCDSENPPIAGYVLNNDDACPEDANDSNSGCEPSYVHENRNWTYIEGYDIDGNLKAKSKSYFDDLGKGEQSQTLDIKTNKIWQTQTMYDAQGRPALQTLSAPINSSGEILYNSDFIKNSTGVNYTPSDFEIDPENPTQVGATANTVGHYYSSNNTDANFEGNSYQDVTGYPFSRTVFSELNPGANLKTLGGNKVDHDNDPNTPAIWLQGYTYSMLASNELSQLDAFNDDKYDTVDIIKTVSRDVHGVEVVVFTDTNGQTLAAARSGGGTSRDMSVKINEQGFVDVHVPVGVVGFTVEAEIGTPNFRVYDLITEQEITTSTDLLSNGFYRVMVANLDTYLPRLYSVTYKENYYDFSLNEYDEAGRLVASYQPLSKLKTEFKYNSLGQLTYSKSPDEGESWFKYREDGQIRFSQNSKQKLANEFSYTNYDNYGRPEESGVVSGVLFDNNLDPNLPLTGGSRTEQQFTSYDAINDTDWDYLNDLFLDSNNNAIYGSPTFLATNVAKTSNENTTTYYSYDVYGRVKWMVQNITDLGAKTIDYKYDPITGNVLEVDYQKHNTAERFVHKYTYNIVDELIQVETSTDGIAFINQAKYEYYETGAMRRTELANNLQGIDYVYNLAGQLKAINDPQGNDPGRDGDTSDSTNEHSNFTPDVFSMRLDYYKGDYTRTGTPTPIGTVTDGTDQFNGNIKAMTWYNKHPDTTPTAQTYYYGYNKNNWLQSAGLGAPVEGTGTAQDSITKNSIITTNEDIVARQSITLLSGFHVQAGTTFTAKIDLNAQGANTGDYNVSNITYDQNGNIKTLNRNKQVENGGSNAMDQLTYEYYDDPNDLNNDFKPNQLKRVDDTAGQVAGADDIGDQDGDNYKYNNIGQLIENVAEQVKYIYNASGLVTEVQHNNQPVVKFYYNDKNHRVRKESFTNGNLTSTDYYIRNVVGNVLAIYNKVNNSTTLTELPIYGASRIGIHYKATNTDRYQLTDHLGNVRAVIARASTNPSTTTDYYPFGMPMPGKQTFGGEQYRYAFQGQEKDPETGKEAFQLRLWDARIGRWLSPDPYGEFHSPYLGMGNNPISLTDPDGGMTTGGCPEPCEILDEVNIAGKTNNTSGYTPNARDWEILAMLRNDFPTLYRTVNARYQSGDYHRLGGYNWRNFAYGWKRGGEDYYLDLKLHGISVTFDVAFPINTAFVSLNPNATPVYGYSISFGEFSKPGFDDSGYFITLRKATHPSIAFGATVDFISIETLENNLTFHQGIKGPGIEYTGNVVIGYSQGTDAPGPASGINITRHTPKTEVRSLSFGPGFNLGLGEWKTHTYVFKK